ncbi:MAG TPA: CpsD/CapB family tyrosine-protein kinase [Gammaproteobacteria bacterium]
MASIEKGLARAREGKLRMRDGDAPELVVAASNTPLSTESLTRVKLNSRALRSNRVLCDEESPAASAYKMLRTRVLQRMRRNGWTTLAVTGTCPDEGKTLTAINLSMSLARDMSTSVILVDLDLRKPAIAQYLGVSPRFGIADYLQGAVSLERAAVRADIDRLGFLLNERPFTNSSEMLTSPQMEALVARLKQGDGRIVVFDMPPLLVTDDMLAFCPLVDGILLVLSQGKTRQSDLLAAKELLQDVNVVGTVLNRSTENVRPYYYYYGYGSGGGRARPE